MGTNSGERERLRERIRRRSDWSRDNLLSDRGTRFVGEGEGDTSASRKGECENGLVVAEVECVAGRELNITISALLPFAEILYCPYIPLSYSSAISHSLEPFPPLVILRHFAPPQNERGLTGEKRF